MKIDGIEGTWEEVQRQGSMLAGQHVRVTVLDRRASRSDGPSQEPANGGPNVAMLQALRQIEEMHKGMNPKTNKQDYLGEARSGAMYGFGDND